MTLAVDCDMHLFEPVDMWRSFCDPADRDVALRMVPDDLGYVWLVAGDRRIWLAEPHQPKRPSTIGDYQKRQRDGQPSTMDYEDFAAPYSDPKAVLAHLDRTGFESAVLFPNYGIVFERPLEADPRTTRANMGAWNRWVSSEIVPAGGGRLHPVGHVNLTDREWLLRQLAMLADGGVRLALMPPALAKGCRLSDPSLDWAWSAFVDHGISPVFHVAEQPRPFADAWYGEQGLARLSALSSIFLWTGVALALTDLIINGVLERHPDLRIGVMELSAVWVPLHLMYMDGGLAFAEAFNGEGRSLALRPSEYFGRQVRVAAFSYEGPATLTEQAGDIFMACSDYPHTEGTDTALQDYAAAGVTPESAPALFSDNVRFLLRN